MSPGHGCAVRGTAPLLIPLFGWAYLLYLYVQPGMDGPNEYGPDPKAADSGKVFT